MPALTPVLGPVLVLVLVLVLGLVLALVLPREREWPARAVLERAVPSPHRIVFPQNDPVSPRRHG